MPQPLPRDRTAIGRGLDDIITGRANGRYPALDDLLAPKLHDYAESPCTEDCPNRRRGQQEGELILDIRPPAGERLAVVEHRINELKENFDEHRTESIRAGAAYATKEELNVIENHVNKLDTQGTFKTIALIFSIVVGLLSLAYNAINLYKVFHI